MQKKIGWLLIIALIQLACNNNTSTENNRYLTLVGTNMKTDDSVFVARRLVNISGSFLFLETLKQDAKMALYCINGDSLSLITKFLNNGMGPYEINNIFSSLLENNKLSFFERNGMLTKGYMIQLNIDSICESISNISRWEKYNFTKIKNFKISSGFAHLADSMLLTAGGKFHEREVLSIINLNDPEKITPLDFWPDDEFTGPPIVKQSVYTDNAYISVNHEHKKILYACGNGKYINIFSISDNKLKNQIPIYNKYPKYTVLDDNLNYKIVENEINHGAKVFTTDSLIFISTPEYNKSMLKSGETYKGYPCYYNDKIEVFDWNGNLKNKYLLDTPCLTFIVDSQNNILYTETDDLETGDSIIRKYYLN